MLERYSKAFNLREFDERPVLQWVVALLLFGTAWDFSDALARNVAAIDVRAPDYFICPNYFQNCEPFVFLTTGTVTNTHHLFFAFGLLGPLILAGYLLYRRAWAGVHITLLYLFFIKILLFFAFDANPPIPFLMFNLVPTAVILFSRSRVADLKWTFVLLYFFSGLVKLDDSWIAGTYFNALREGLRVFSNRGIAIYTNIVILFELFGVWFFLHKSKYARYGALTFYVVFHLYSAVYVGFRYPLLTLPLLLLLFLNDDTEEGRVSSTGVILTAMLLVFNVLPLAAGLQPKLTGEGAQFALNMFDANRQGVVSHEIIFQDGRSEKGEEQWTDSYHRIRPYNKWFQLKHRCSDKNVKQIEYSILLSVNGGPYRRVVNLSDLCKTEFHPFSRNDWIQLDGPIVGYPERNYYSWMDGPGHVKMQPVEQFGLDALGSFFLRNLTVFQWFYWILAGLTFLAMSIPRLRALGGFKL